MADIDMPPDSPPRFRYKHTTRQSRFRKNESASAKRDPESIGGVASIDHELETRIQELSYLRLLHRTDMTETSCRISPLDGWNWTGCDLLITWPFPSVKLITLD
ncbi:MAG: hypothetical protein ACLRS8_14610 [Parabacteroides merdae]